MFILSPGEKNKVIAIYDNLVKYYEVYSHEFYQHNERVGKDTIAYTTEEVLAKQLPKKLRDWKARRSNHILHSYVIRVNGIIVDFAHKAFKEVGADAAQAILEKWFVSYPGCELPPSFKRPPENFDGSLFYDEKEKVE